LLVKKCFPVAGIKDFRIENRRRRMIKNSARLRVEYSFEMRNDLPRYISVLSVIGGKSRGV